MIRQRRLAPTLILITLLLRLATPGCADVPTFTPILFSKLQATGVPGNKEKEVQVEKVMRVYWKDGILIDGWGDRLRIKVGGELQLDGGFFHLDDALQDKFGDHTSNGKVRRARVYLTGTFRKHFSFKTEWDITGSDGAVIKDNYLSITDIPVVRKIQIGYMQEPFTLNRTTSNTAIPFMERSLADTLVPRSNVGIYVNAGPRNKSYTLSFGYFYDSDNFGNPKGNANAATGRFTYLPLYEKDGDRLLHFGFSYSFRNQAEDTARFQQSPETFLLPHFVDTHTFVADYLNVFGWETVYQTHRLAIESEYVLSDTH